MIIRLRSEVMKMAFTALKIKEDVWGGGNSREGD